MCGAASVLAAVGEVVHVVVGFALELPDAIGLDLADDQRAAVRTHREVVRNTKALQLPKAQ